MLHCVLECFFSHACTSVHQLFCNSPLGKTGYTIYEIFVIFEIFMISKKSKLPNIQDFLQLNIFQIPHVLKIFKIHRIVDKFNIPIFFRIFQNFITFCKFARTLRIFLQIIYPAFPPAKSWKHVFILPRFQENIQDFLD